MIEVFHEVGSVSWMVELVALRPVGPRRAARRTAQRIHSLTRRTGRPLCAGLFCRSATKPTVVGQPSRLPLVHWPSRLVILFDSRDGYRTEAGGTPAPLSLSQREAGHD